MSMIFGSVSNRVGTTFNIHFLHLEHSMPGQFKELYQQNYNRQKGLVFMWMPIDQILLLKYVSAQMVAACLNLMVFTCILSNQEKNLSWSSSSIPSPSSSPSHFYPCPLW